MKKLRNILTILLCFAMVLSCFSLVGCGDKKPTVSKISNDDVEGSVKVTTEDPFAGIEKYKGTTVRFATWIDHTANESAKPIADFTDKYGINLQLVPVNQGDYLVKLSGLIGAGQSPDLIVDNLRMPAVFPYAQPLNNIPSFNLDDPFWDQAYEDVTTINGNTYFVNSVNSPWTYRYMVFFNKKLFEDNNFKSPAEYYEDGEWTIDNFVKCASQISKLGDDYVGASVRLQTAAAIFGTEIVKFENGKFVNNLNDTKLRAAYKWVMDNKDKGLFVTTENYGGMKENKMGLVVGGDFGLRTTGSFKGMDPDNLGFAPMPKVTKDGPQPRGSSFRAYGVCKGAENPVAVGYFLRYYLDYDNYDTSSMFDTQRAADYYKYIRTVEADQYLMLSQGVLDLSAGEGSNQKLYTVITNSTSAQLDVNLSKLKNDVDSCVNKANAFLDDKANEE